MRAVLTQDLSGKSTDRKLQSLTTNSFCSQTFLEAYAYRKCQGLFICHYSLKFQGIWESKNCSVVFYNSDTCLARRA